MSDFDILAAPLHWIPVRFPVLRKVEGDDEAVSVMAEEEIEVRVELVDRDEAAELFPKMFDKDQEPRLGEIALFLRLVKAWRKIKAGGNPFPLNEENVARLLKVPMFGASFANAYIGALGGRIAIREGNSDGLPSGGQAVAPESAPKVSSSATVADSA
jgi:hypothetical protein